MSTISTTRLRWSALAIALAAAGFAWFRADPAADTASARADVAAIAAPDAPGAEPPRTTPMTARAHGAAAAAPAPTNDWQTAYGCTGCARGFAVAASAADAAWLAQHGYPSQAQRRAYAALSESELEARGNAGDSVALGQLGDRLMLRGDARVYDVYEQGAALGSLYALYRLADAYERSDTPFARNEAAALLRVASMQGDYDGARELQRRFPRLGGADLLLVDQQAQQLLEQLTQRRQQRGLGPLTIQPRPGLREALQTAAAP